MEVGTSTLLLSTAASVADFLRGIDVPDGPLLSLVSLSLLLLSSFLLLLLSSPLLLFSLLSLFLLPSSFSSVSLLSLLLLWLLLLLLLSTSSFGLIRVVLTWQFQGHRSRDRRDLEQGQRNGNATGRQNMLGPV